jgi:hypothetical protein
MREERGTCTSLYSPNADLPANALKRLAGVEGLEPPTLGLEIRCSIRLSYTPSIYWHHKIPLHCSQSTA